MLDALGVLYPLGKFCGGCGVNTCQAPAHATGIVIEQLRQPALFGSDPCNITDISDAERVKDNVRKSGH